jgi:hypothetical protein
MPLSPNTKLDRMEEKACWCGAAGSGEGHAPECPASIHDRIPRKMTAAQALVWLRAQKSKVTRG